MKELLKKAGVKLNKRNWPKLSREQLVALGITPEMVSAETVPATVYTVMGPHWKYGVFVCGRPRAFKQQ